MTSVKLVLIVFQNENVFFFHKMRSPLAIDGPLFICFSICLLTAILGKNERRSPLVLSAEPDKNKRTTKAAPKGQSWWMRPRGDDDVDVDDAGRRGSYLVFFLSRCLGWNHIGSCFTQFYLVLLGVTGFYLVVLSVLLGFTGFYWVLLGFNRFNWVSPSFT